MPVPVHTYIKFDTFGVCVVIFSWGVVFWLTRGIVQHRCSARDSVRGRCNKPGCDTEGGG